MISAAQVAQAAQILGLAIPVVVEALKAVQCAVEDCDVELLPADAPDLLQRARDNRNDLVKRAAGVDRTSIDERLGRGVDEGDVYGD